MEANLQAATEPDPDDLDSLLTPFDTRGMDTLRRMLAPRRTEAAARRLLDADSVVIATGFRVNGAPETDGPPGAIALSRALRALGKHTTLLSFDAVVNAVVPYDAFDVLVDLSEAAPGAYASRCVVAIEICGAAEDGRYYNMHGQDVSGAAPDFERVLGDCCTIAIGDGGNEFGLGRLPRAFFETRPMIPPRSTAEVVINASTSNLGAYGLTAQLSVLAARDLVPEGPHEMALIEDLVKKGFVDGYSGNKVLKVDGEPLTATVERLDQLRRFTRL